MFIVILILLKQICSSSLSVRFKILCIVKYFSTGKGNDSLTMHICCKLGKFELNSNEYQIKFE